MLIHLCCVAACFDDDFVCMNGQCIRNHINMICNARNDCGDWTDEVNCGMHILFLQISVKSMQKSRFFNIIISFKSYRSISKMPVITLLFFSSVHSALMCVLM